uniref:Uncharacterized protein n=1 Tax=Acrobeloides nanus TaxID=290746 RepID=A0A914EKD1_9BILA
MSTNIIKPFIIRETAVDTIVPNDIKRCHRQSDDLLAAFNMCPGEPIENHDDDLMSTTSLLRPSISVLQEVENIEEEDEHFVDYKEILENIQAQRREAAKNLKIQAERMQKASNKRFQHVEVGTTVRIPVPHVDRAKVDHRNVMGVVIEANEGINSSRHLPTFFQRMRFHQILRLFDQQPLRLRCLDKVIFTATALLTAIRKDVLV